MATTIALDPKKPVFEQTAPEVVLEFLAYESREVTATAFDLGNQARVVLSDDGIEYGLPVGR